VFHFDAFPVSEFLLDYFVAFSALTLLVERREGHSACKKTEWWGGGVLICLKRGADLHFARLMPLPLTVSCYSKIQIGFWYRLTRVVPDKGSLNGVCVCVYFVPDFYFWPNFYVAVYCHVLVTLLLHSFYCQ